MNALFISGITDDQLAAFQRILTGTVSGGHQLTTESLSTPIPADVQVSTPPPSPVPPVPPVVQGGDLPAGAWLSTEVNVLLRALELDGSRAQAEAMRRAMASPVGTVSREEINAIRGSDGGLQGFSKPINRVAKRLVRHRQLPERERGSIWETMYVNGTAEGYRIVARIVDDAEQSVGEPGHRDANGPGW